MIPPGGKPSSTEITHRYIAADTLDDFERERISLLRRLLDPNTIERLTRLGVQRGWRCLEVGAGDGSVARWLAEQVGAEGKVVATDINLRFLTDAPPPNLDFRLHDILSDPIEEAYFDLVHCRALLINVSDPEIAIRNMIRALRPGGWILMEESDFTSFGAADDAHPSAKEFDRICSAIIESLHLQGIVNVRFGRKLRNVVEALDLSAVDHEATTRLHRFGEVGYLYHTMNFCHLVKPKVLRESALDESDFQRLEEIFSDPTFSFVDRTIFAVWGRKK